MRRPFIKVLPCASAGWDFVDSLSALLFRILEPSVILVAELNHSVLFVNQAFI